MNTDLQRLQNVLAQRGQASRRGAAAMILAGRVRVNDRIVTEPGLRVDPQRDAIQLDGHSLPSRREPARTLLLHKPPGIVCSADNRQGRTVLDLVQPCRERLVPAGRLDKDSEGLVILSNDGELILRLTHPRHGHRKTYRVTVRGVVSPDALHSLRLPIEIEGYRTHPADVRRLRTTAVRTELEVTLGEGRNRQIRRLCERAGLRIERLVRTRIGNLTLDGLPPGAWRDLRPAEIRGLLSGPA